MKTWFCIDPYSIHNCVDNITSAYVVFHVIVSIDRRGGVVKKEAVTGK
jgi:hypothetical protein